MVSDYVSQQPEEESSGVGDPPSTGSATARIRQEHFCIRQLVGAVQREIGPLAIAEETVGRPGTKIGVVAALLTELRDVLGRHFVAEQHSLYDEILALAPRFESSLVGLAGEHTRILERLDAIIAEARTTENRRAELDLVVRVAGLLEYIGNHEAREEELLVRASWEDIGGGG